MPSGRSRDETMWTMTFDDSSVATSERTRADCAWADANASATMGSSGRGVSGSPATANEGTRRTANRKIDKWRIEQLHQTGDTRSSPRRDEAVKTHSVREKGKNYCCRI